LGIALVESYRAMGMTLHLPYLRATMEKRMSLVADGSKSKEEMICQTISEMETILKNLQQNK
jgi:DNA topoisomerase IA